MAYRQNCLLIRDFPYNIEKDIEPVYVEMPGWKTDMTGYTDESQFPKEFLDYINFIEKELETPIDIVSIGQDSEQTNDRKK